MEYTEKTKEYYKQYYLKNNERIREYAKNYYQQHKEKLSAYQSYYRKHNKERLNAYYRAYYQKHKDEIKERAKKRYSEKYGMYYAQNKERWQECRNKRKQSISDDPMLAERAKRLKEYRKAFGWSQEAIALEIDKSQQYISMVERAEIEFNPSAFSSVPELVEYVTGGIER